MYEFDANGHGADTASWDCDVKDPSFVIHENGTTVIAYRGIRCDGLDHTESVGLLVAPAWNATYHRTGTVLFVDNEDLFMWIDGRGTHMIMHSQLTDHPTSMNIGSDHKKKRGTARIVC